MGWNHQLDTRGVQSPLNGGIGSATIRSVGSLGLMKRRFPKSSSKIWIQEYPNKGNRPIESYSKPIASMGLVYLPTFTIKNWPNLGKDAIHRSYSKERIGIIQYYYKERIGFLLDIPPRENYLSKRYNRKISSYPSELLDHTLKRNHLFQRKWMICQP